jgi:hypothetical protein
MKVELRREFYRVTYEALEWLCIAERLEEWSLSDGWPAEREDERTAVAAWARGIYGAAISDRERFTLSLPRDWTWWLLNVLIEATRRDDEFPWTLSPSLIGQIKTQNRRKARTRLHLPT